MHKRVTFDNRWLPYLLVAPQIAVTVVFFLWPAGQALQQSVYRVTNAFTGAARFVWFENFERLFGDSHYWDSVQVTFVFSAAVTLLSMAAALFLAVMADRVVKGASLYKTLLVWPYAVAPAVAGVLWLFLFQPAVGIVSYELSQMGQPFNFRVDGTQAMLLVILAAAWKQISYNFLFFLAGLQAIPKSLVEAAAIDGAGPAKRFWTIVFPLLSPTTFFLLVVNIVYAFFDTFSIIHAVTAGGPAGATNILVYKVYNDGFIGLDLGGSAAQSVVLMAIVVTLTVVQFRFIERRVHY
ncbi:MAG: sn-glycerol-3-phosphate ABC transporter permease UgpA [Rhodospirillaceae bacterium]|nr:sn-glycerol-3-phosphate ABC transporter permease UgpA [Rhodospirillaceae bacterium]